MKHLQLVFAALALLSTVTARAEVNDNGVERRFSIADSTQGMTMPRGDWAITKEQRRADGKVGYYMMYSEQARTVLSVYIDKVGPCHSAQECLDAAPKNPMYKNAQEVKTSEDRQFKLAQFYLEKQQGLEVNQAHVLASAYVDGLWFDIHISQTSKERPDIKALLELVRTLELK